MAIPMIGLIDAILLVALGFGYIVIYLANREEKILKTLGLAIGTIIITICLTTVISNLIINATMNERICSMQKNAAFQKHHMMHPGMPQPLPRK